MLYFPYAIQYIIRNTVFPLLQPKVAYYYVTREISVRPGPAGPAAPFLSRCPVTHPWMGYLAVSVGAETRGIAVSQHAESIGEGPSF